MKYSLQYSQFAIFYDTHTPSADPRFTPIDPGLLIYKRWHVNNDFTLQPWEEQKPASVASQVDSKLIMTKLLNRVHSPLLLSVCQMFLHPVRKKPLQVEEDGDRRERGRELEPLSRPVEGVEQNHNLPCAALSISSFMVTQLWLRRYLDPPWPRLNQKFRIFLCPT